MGSRVEAPVCRIHSRLQRFGVPRCAQHLVEHYLLGRCLIGLFSRPESLLRGLGLRPLPADWLTLRVVSDWVRTENRFQDLQSLLLQWVGRGVAFKNLLQVAVLSADR